MQTSKSLNISEIRSSFGTELSSALMGFHTYIIFSVITMEGLVMAGHTLEVVTICCKYYRF